MCRLHKLAWYQLLVLVGWIIITAAVAALVYWRGLDERIIIIPLLLGVLVHFDRVFFPLRPGRIEYDERDAAIKQKALNIAYGIFWYAFLLGSLAVWIIAGPDKSIPAGVLLAMIFFGAIVLRLVWSIAVIVQYGIFSKENDARNVARVQK